MRILGIDPGLADLGYGVIEQGPGERAPRMIVHGVIRTAAGEPMARRLALIHDGLEAVIAEHRPVCAAVEQLFFATNMKTAIAVAQARGVAILSTARAGLDFAEYTPLQIKLAIAGYGQASKLQVQQMVKMLLGLPEIPRPDHAADALAVALCHLHGASTVAARTAAVAAEAIPGDSAIVNANKALLGQSRRRRR